MKLDWSFVLSRVYQETCKRAVRKKVICSWLMTNFCSSIFLRYLFVDVHKSKTIELVSYRLRVLSQGLNRQRVLKRIFLPLLVNVPEN